MFSAMLGEDSDGEPCPTGGYLPPAGWQPPPPPPPPPPPARDFSQFVYTGDGAGPRTVTAPGASAGLRPIAPLGPSVPSSSFYGAGGGAGGAGGGLKVKLSLSAKPALAALLERKRAEQAGGGARRPPPRPGAPAEAPAPKRPRPAHPTLGSSDEDDAASDEEDGGSDEEEEEEEEEDEAGGASEEEGGKAYRPGRRKAAVLQSSGEEDDGEGGSDSGGPRARAPAAAGAQPDALARCAAIAADLRAALGGAAARDRVAAVAAEGEDGDAALGVIPSGGARADPLRLLSAADIAQRCCAPAEAAAPAPPPPPPLKSYQVVGVNFLMLLLSRGVGGAILADEMGLGKTAQAVSFVACALARARAAGQPRRPALVVAPASVLENWARELALWAPGLRVLTLHGSERAAAREAADEAWRAGGSAAASFDVLLVCYTMFERDSAEQLEDRRWLRRLRFETAVLDEAHLVKNRESQRAARLRAVLHACCAHRLMLTGTPMQNDLAELLSLLELLNPDVFSLDALLAGGEDLAVVIERSAAAAALAAAPSAAAPEGAAAAAAAAAAAEQAAAAAAGGGAEAAIARVRDMLAPFVLRRLKSEVLSQLVAKTQHVEVLRPLAAQAALYRASVASVRREVSAKARRGGAAAAAPAQQLERSVGAARLKALFTHLRKVANHPLLVRSRFTQGSMEEVIRLSLRRCLFGPAAPERKVREHCEGLSDFALHSLCCDPRTGGALAHLRLPPDAALSSCKAARLAELLPALRERGSRPLIFSQWKIMLDILEWLLQHLGLPFYRMDGSTPVAERQALVDAYNAPGSPCFAFLLSTRAGGQGINLTSADTVILHDTDFNPQIDRQAEDRCHRLGQTRPVTVYRFVAEGTVDARIVEIAQRKLHLDAAVLSSDKEEKAAEGRTMAELLLGLLEEAAGEEAPAAPLRIVDLAD